MTERRFQPGFRLSAFDLGILIVGSGVAAYVATIQPWTGVAIGFVVGHFFLFCNVLRMSRSLELIWATIFSGLAVAATVDAMPWWVTLTTSILITIVITTIELQRPWYHGAGWEWVNPGLPEWWKARKETH